ncbi:MAG: hypothetical protein CVU65_03320 [Deltaproteobacteria bacterium HGW-Deltaproteobacteria-22]|jgi:hypothetical protein|nr:MAG: hypothetical protein CVU65_03320 [Deltaproteobacteria bacterium HGW-Deltaproteobacteria-22]
MPFQPRLMTGLSMFVFFLIALPCREAAAQIVNVQDLFINRSGEGLQLGSVAKTEIKTGNTDYQYYNVSAVARYLHGRHTVVGTGNFEYAEKSGEAFTNKHFEHLRYRLEVLGPVGLDAFFQHEFNEFRRINLRLLAGVGPTWKVVNSEKVYLFLGSVYMYELNELGGGDYDDAGQTRRIHRWNNYVTFQWNLKKDIKFLTTLYYQPAFSEFSDYNLLWNANLSVAINPWLSVVLTYNFSRQNVPPQGVNPWDSALVAGLAIKTGLLLR